MSKSVQTSARKVWSKLSFKVLTKLQPSLKLTNIAHCIALNIVQWTTIIISQSHIIQVATTAMTELVSGLVSDKGRQRPSQDPRPTYFTFKVRRGPCNFASVLMSIAVKRILHWDNFFYNCFATKNWGNFVKTSPRRIICKWGDSQSREPREVIWCAIKRTLPKHKYEI